MRLFEMGTQTPNVSCATALGGITSANWTIKFWALRLFCHYISIHAEPICVPPGLTPATGVPFHTVNDPANHHSGQVIGQVNTKIIMEKSLLRHVLRITLPCRRH